MEIRQGRSRKPQIDPAVKECACGVRREARKKKVRKKKKEKTLDILPR